MDNLDYVRASKLIREMGYIGLQVRAAMGNVSYVLFIKESVYNDKRQVYPSYSPSSAIFRHMADFIYDYRSKQWLKQAIPIQDIQITPAEMVLYGK